MSLSFNWGTRTKTIKVGGEVQTLSEYKEAVAVFDAIASVTFKDELAAERNQLLGQLEERSDEVEAEA